MTVFRIALSIFLPVSLSLFEIGGAHAQNADLDQLRAEANANTVGIMGGSFTGSNAALVWDMRRVLDDGRDLRIVPINGTGSVQAIEDLLVLRGVDLATVQSDVLEYYERQPGFADIKEKIVAVAKLHEEEMHVLAPLSVRTVFDLEGKRVNFGSPSSGGYLTASGVFQRLGITVQASTLGHTEALDKLLAGEFDAMVRMVGKPNSLFGDLKSDQGLHLLAIPYEAIGAPYGPARFSSADYPTLTPADQPIETISVSSVLAAQNWPEGHDRRRRIEKFIKRFHAKFDELRSGRYHPKWVTIDPNARVPGWVRLLDERPVRVTTDEPIKPECLGIENIAKSILIHGARGVEAAKQQCGQ